MRTPSPDRRNFLVFAIHLVALRVGWVFKTESVMIPAFMDMLQAGAVGRAFLPVLSRLCGSIPQYLLSSRLATVPRLRGYLFAVTLAQALPWYLLAAAMSWSVPIGGYWVLFFLLLYSLFWAGNGIGLLLHGTMQSKLIEASRRGRLMAVSNVAGSLAGIAVVAVWMLPTLARGQDARVFQLIFVTTGILYTIGAGIALGFREPARENAPPLLPTSRMLRRSTQLILRDSAYRRLIVVLTLYYVIILLFHHFQSFGVLRFGRHWTDLAWWVILQNAGTAGASLCFGPLADRMGNRASLRLLLAILALVPLLALGLASLDPEVCRRWYGLTFLVLGFAVVAGRLFTNYVIELAPAEEVEHYLGTMNLWQVVPLLFAPITGLAIDRFGFEPILIVGSVLLAMGSYRAGYLKEPRNQPGTGALPVADGL